MHINIKTKTLLNSLEIVNRSISSKTIIPALSGILFDVKTERLVLTSSSGSTSIQTWINRDDNELLIQKVGKFLIKSKFITDVIRKIDQEMIELEIIDQKVIRINTNYFDSELNIMNYLDFPKIHFINTGKKTKLSLKIIKEIIKNIAFATANKETTRTTLNGVHIFGNKNKLIALATDSNRLAKQIFLNHDYQEIDLVIPKEILEEIIKINNNEKDEIKLITNNRYILFETRNTLIQGRCIEGIFPDVEKVIPKKSETNCTLLTNHLISAIERALVLSSEKTISIQISITDKNIKISSKSIEIGNSNEEINDFKKNGPDVTFIINGRLILDALKVFDKKEVVLGINSDVKPITITENINESKNILQLVLPMRPY